MTMAMCSMLALFFNAIIATSAIASEADSATCGDQNAIADQCRITWNFARSPRAYFWVQQFDSQSAEWQRLNHQPSGNSVIGSLETPVEAGNLYRVIGCDDESATINCVGSSMVWAPYILPPEQVHLIPGLIASTGQQGGYAGMVFKNADWLTQVVQHNVYLMANAVARADVSMLPDMTPVADLRETQSTDAMDNIRFNVYAAYLGAQGRPLEMPLYEPEPRRPHVHPERHAQ